MFLNQIGRRTLLAAFFLGLVPLLSPAQPTTQKDFLTAFVVAVESKSPQKLEALTYSVGMSESDKEEVASLQKVVFTDAPIDHLWFDSVPTDIQPFYIVNGKKWEPTYPPAGQVRIQYKPTPNGPNTTSCPYAIIDGHYFLVSTKSTDLGWKGPQDKSLGFTVSTRGPQDKVQVMLKWNASGVEVQRIFNQPSGLVPGQYIEQATAISDNPNAVLTLSDSGKEIFHSQPLKAPGPIEYKKP